MLAGHELIELIQAGYIDAPINQVGTSSIDVRLGGDMAVERGNWFTRLFWFWFHKPIDPTLKSDHQWRKQAIPAGGYLLRPGQFILASTDERVALPDYITAQLLLKSSIARTGCNHLYAAFIDAGFMGNITLELHNVSSYPIKLTRGMKISQLRFDQHVPTGDMSYAKRGQYVGDKAKGTVASQGAK